MISITAVARDHLQLLSYLSNWKWSVLGEDLDHQMNQHVRVELMTEKINYHDGGKSTRACRSVALVTLVVATISVCLIKNAMY